MGSDRLSRCIKPILHTNVFWLEKKEEKNKKEERIMIENHETMKIFFTGIF